MLNKLFLLFAISVVSFSFQAIAEDDAKDKKNQKEEPKLSPEEKQAETLKLMDLFSDVYQKVRDDYVTEETDKKLIEAAINGMLTNLDPHSSFLNEEDFKDMQEQTKGEFGGLGIEVTMKNGLVYVVAPIDDTPAFKAGIKAGDYISHIDGEAVYGLSISEAVKKMRGKPGESIDLKVIREGEKRPLDINIVRDIIKIKSVKSKTYDDVAYIRITSFTENTGKQVEDNIKKIFAEVGKNKIKGVVLDLRNNPGGLLTEAISVSDDFLNTGEIVSTRGRHPEDSQKFSAEVGDVTNGLPVVVLINGGSASASEIVSGALQDQKRAVIIGEKSFGKGSVQTVIPVASNTAIRLTTSRYYTPSGKSIQAEGITPDIEVKQGKIIYDEDFDKTKEANLVGHLENEKGENSKEQEKIKKLVNKLKKDKNADISNQDLDELAKSEDDKPLDETDYQLARALDLVRALFIYGNR